MNQAVGNAGLRKWIWALVASILLIPVSADAQTQRTVTGTVVDETGEPLIGATVQVSGESIGTSTDMDGRYSLNVPAKAKRLTFSYVGYEKMEVDITSDVINVTMKPGDALLDEVVVIGYGTQKKNDLTGSVSSVSEKDFNQGVISSPEELINGKDRRRADHEQRRFAQRRLHDPLSVAARR